MTALITSNIATALIILVIVWIRNKRKGATKDKTLLIGAMFINAMATERGFRRKMQRDWPSLMKTLDKILAKK